MARSSHPDPERSPTPDETLLWRWMTRHDQSYIENEMPLHNLLDVDVYAGEQETRRPSDIRPASPVQKKTQKQQAPDPLMVGNYAGVDRRTAQRMRRGQLPVDVILDLHGSAQIEACERLYKCITRACESQKRVVLVITGKGRKGEGVLRQQLPHWLNDPLLRPYVLAFDQAAIKDGAGGAFYVLLKRKRSLV